jgi:CheY-like chemotaxis protein
MASRDGGPSPRDTRVFWLASSRGGRPAARPIRQSPERAAESVAQAARIVRRVRESPSTLLPARTVVPLAPSATGQRPQGAGVTGWLRGRSVLVVEDDEDSREVLRLIVESCGATVRLAVDGAEALARVGEARPDLVLCDLRMPGVDGFTFLERLRADPRSRHVRVVAVTALDSDEDVARTWAAGFDGHVVKPIDLELMTTLLERVFWANRRPR